MARRLPSAAPLAAAAATASLAALLACDPPPLANPPLADQGPAFVCPIPERVAEDPGPLPEADPDRLRLSPEIGATCDLASKPLQRLNRAEYDNTTRDLLGVDLHLAQGFPTDNSVEGFDNIAGQLTVSPFLVEKYFEAARQLVDAALSRGAPPPRVQVIEAETYLGGDETSGVAVIDAGARGVQFPVRWEGTYKIRVMAYGEQAGNDVVRMAVTLGNDEDAPEVGTFEVLATQDAPQLYEGSVHLTEGNHPLYITFVNDWARPDDRGLPGLNRNLVIDFLEIDGPYDPVPGEDPPARRALLTCQPTPADAVASGEVASEDVVTEAECGREILTRMARRALRRPVTESEIDRYLGFFQVARVDGLGFEDGLKLALRALLMHPEFLFRVETDPSLDDDTPHPLSDHELASRLSYFLWSSMPDDRLLDLADRGALQDPVVLEGEVRRMLKDEKARALTENFAGQWLNTRAVDEVSLDAARYKDWDEDLKLSARCETELLFDDVLRSGGRVEDLLLADYTFLNPRLAEHYDLRTPETNALVAPEGAHPAAAFTRVSLEGSGRVGILTHTSFLSLTSHPNRTSPVKRGKWVLEQVLCAPPDPPPPNVEGLIENDATPQTLREQLEAHRADPVCASCHSVMDPIGLGLENFDASGKYRATDNGLPIDASSSLFGVLPFNGAEELAPLLAAQPETARCAVEKTLTWATGQALERWGADACMIDETLAAFNEEEHRLEDLFVLVAKSAAFRLRRAGPDEDAAALAAAMEGDAGADEAEEANEEEQP